MTIGWNSPNRGSVKKIKIERTEEIEKLNFWDEANIPSSPFTSEIDVDSLLLKGHTSFKVCKVEKGEECDVLRGKDDERLEVYGLWRKALPPVGVTVAVMRCLCCIENRNSDLLSVTDTKNYMIVHARKSLTITRIVQSMTCLRKSYIEDKVSRYNEEVSFSLVHGKILHEWFLYLMQNPEESFSSAVKALKSILSENIIEIYQAGVPLDHAFRESLKCMGSLRKFIGALQYSYCTNPQTRYSQKFQMKGKSDAIIQNNGIETEIELKTGKNIQIENLAQVILYGLMQQERSGYSSQILFHMPSNTEKEIHLKHSEVTGMLLQRNQLSLMKTLPEKKEISFCRICPVRESCQALEEIEAAEKKNSCTFSQSTIENSLMADPSKVLRKMDLENPLFFSYVWQQIQEEEEMSAEPLIRCTIEKWEEHFLRIQVDKNEIYSGVIHVNEHVIIYDSSSCIVCGGVAKVVEYDENTMLFFEIATFSTIIMENLSDRVVFLSRDPGASGFAEIRASMLLLYGNLRIKQIWKNRLKSLKGKEPVHPEYSKLNEDQKNALLSALSMQPYTIIHGMPGTGKTTVISLLIRILACQKKKVLVCCYTRLALQNIQDRLERSMEKKSLSIYRTGETKINTEKTSIEDIKQQLDGYNVILSTTRAFFRDIIFEKNRQFDMCIVDEATQQNFLLSVLPTKLSDSLVLVGDHLQLHPLGNVDVLKVSLFELLRERSPVSSLTIQYRMPKCIMDVANAMFYDNQMKCKRQEIGNISFINMEDDKEANVFIREKNSPHTQFLCYFNEQVRRLKNLGVYKASTVDRFQGSEADHVILLIDTFLWQSISMEILLSSQRLNVGVTRARCTLTIVGSYKRLASAPLFAKLFSYIEPVNYKPKKHLDD
ncbi:DNA replication ATP-dependent helicase/nuclease Dna2 [Nematocida sp. LUAm3]|nr:DNA replication ATP-dependent helicase/nuclease Dna2 [Nematocida sp. LUAm3]KAI5175496.1 DNA replication ATP-dependent helicase/nuclease Dna2 [Nematocida sp. LUAm2]KAI5178474.1 DNA replication ATP-dependent helicase/nuclease Dna2 [Nematocida sp. LUAm1]